MKAQASEVTYWTVRVTEYRRKTVFATLLSFLLVIALSICVVSDFLWPSVVMFVALVVCVAVLVSNVLDWRSSVEFRDAETEQLADLMNEVID
jgi:hypothetical protein